MCGWAKTGWIVFVFAFMSICIVKQSETRHRQGEYVWGAKAGPTSKSWTILNLFQLVAGSQNK